MEVGDMDGLGVVYTRLGEPILDEGEVLVAQRPASVFALFEGRRAKGQPLLHHRQGETVLHLTDRRIVTLIDPSLGRARDVLKLPGDESWTKGMELFEVIQGRGRYYMVLGWGEVPRVKVPPARKETSTVTIKADSGGTYVLLVDRETAGWMGSAWHP